MARRNGSSAKALTVCRLYGAVLVIAKLGGWRGYAPSDADRTAAAGTVRAKADADAEHGQHGDRVPLPVRDPPPDQVKLRRGASGLSQAVNPTPASRGLSRKGGLARQPVERRDHRHPSMKPTGGQVLAYGRHPVASHAGAWIEARSTSVGEGWAGLG